MDLRLWNTLLVLGSISEFYFISSNATSFRSIHKMKYVVFIYSIFLLDWRLNKKVSENFFILQQVFVKIF